MLLFDNSYFTPQWPPFGRLFTRELQPTARRALLITLYPYRLPIKKIIKVFHLNIFYIYNMWLHKPCEVVSNKLRQFQVRLRQISGAYIRAVLISLLRFPEFRGLDGHAALILLLCGLHGFHLQRAGGAFTTRTRTRFAVGAFLSGLLYISAVDFRRLTVFR